jgi:hypothetical protein
MRAVLLVMLVGCNPLAVPEHPAVIQKLDQVPEAHRDEAIDTTTLIRPTSENQPTTAKGRRQETVAAFAAAMIGDMFSKDSNVDFGLDWVDTTPQKKHPAPEEKPSAPQPAPAVDSKELVPWIRLDH